MADSTTERSHQNSGLADRLLSASCLYIFWHYNVEIGQRPGPKLGKEYKTNGSYVSAGFGLTLGFYKGFKKLKSKV